MANLDESASIVVSLQDRTAGHRALGVLIGTDIAVFDLAPGADVSDDAELEVLVAPSAPGPDDVIERIRPLQVVIASLDSSPDTRIALVTLAQDSRYGGPLPTFTRDEFFDALRNSLEIWSALQLVGVAPSSLQRVDPGAALSRIAAAETSWRSRLVRRSVARTPEEIADCPFSDTTVCRRGGFLLDRDR
jgi:hypothetical protein